MLQDPLALQGQGAAKDGGVASPEAQQALIQACRQKGALAPALRILHAMLNSQVTDRACAAWGIDTAFLCVQGGRDNPHAHQSSYDVK